MRSYLNIVKHFLAILRNENLKPASNISSYTQTSCLSSRTITPMSFVLKRSYIEDGMEYAQRSRGSLAPAMSIVQEPGYEVPRRLATSPSFQPILSKSSEMNF
jgi:hypothetical protein